MIGSTRGPHPQAVGPQHVSRVIQAAALCGHEEAIETFRKRLKKPDAMLELFSRTYRNNGLGDVADLIDRALRP